MATPERFDELSRGLVDGVARHPDLVGLALLGSASDQARDRRDEWSDHDFLAIVAPGRGQALRPDLGWLPDPDSLALTAREGEIGFVAVYDDGHVMEFAVAEASGVGMPIPVMTAARGRSSSWSQKLFNP